MAKGNFGERLKREREMREVSQREITSATRIGQRFLEALENEEWDKLPGGVFNRGFVRAIARYLGLDEEDLLSEYDLARGEQALSAPPPAESGIPSPPLWIPAVALLAALLAIAGLVAGGVYGWRLYSAYRAKKHSSSASSASPAPSLPSPSTLNSIASSPAASANPSSRAPASAPAPVSVPLELSVSTSAATHVRVVGDGEVRFDSDLAPGDTWHFSARRQFEVTAADSSAVLLELNGRAMPPIGSPGASGTIVLSQKDLRQASGGTSQP
jgi:cytoskeletal protein RodZ